MKNAHGPSLLAGLDLNLLHVFHVVYRERSVSQAALLLSVSQSAVSHAIGRLRLRLGASLFEQQGRGLVPTTMADRLAPAVSAALIGLEDALAGRQEYDPQRDIGQLILAMPSQLEPLLFPSLVEKLTQKAPAVVVQSVRRATYLAARHVAVSSRRHGPSLVDALLIQNRLRRRIAVRCQRYEAACAIAVSSDMLLTMGSRHASLLGRAIPLNIVPLDISFPSYRVYLYWPQRRDGDPTMLWIRSALQEICAPTSAA